MSSRGGDYGRRRERSWERNDRDRDRGGYSSSRRDRDRDRDRGGRGRDGGRRRSRSRSPGRSDRDRKEKDRRDYGRDREDDRGDRDRRDGRDRYDRRDSERDSRRGSNRDRETRDTPDLSKSRSVEPSNEILHQPPKPKGGDQKDVTMGAARPNLDPDGSLEEGEEIPDENEEDATMMAMMGLQGFGSTKGKHVEGNQEGSVNIKKMRTWRQYMNRRGGFNRPLDKIK